MLNYSLTIKTSAAIMTMLATFFATCGQSESRNADTLKRDHEEISTLLDRALLSESPIDTFKVLTGKIRSYPSVDSAWVEGGTFFVKYKNGGTVTWTITNQSNK
jgi:hypothetical protein